MKTSKQLPSGKWMGSAVRSAVTTITIAALTLLASGLARAGGTVTSCTEANLRAAMAGGGTVTFACDGTITLANTISNAVNTVLDATGHQITISGSNAVRVFYVGTNVALTLSNLTIANGCSTNTEVYSAGGGGAIFNNGGTVVLSGTTFQANNVRDDSSYGATGGAAIFNAAGSLAATNCVFASNVVQAMFGTGGALCSVGGSVALENCRFSSNSVFGSGNTGGYGASGGAICIGNGASATIHNCAFMQNLVAGASGYPDYSQNPMPGYPGYAGGSGGATYGGAICNWGQAQVQSSLFVNNSAVGGNGGAGQNGGVSGDWPYMGGNGGAGGDADGAAVFNGGTISLVNCTFVGNSGLGGDGGNGGLGSSLWWKGVYHSAGPGSHGYGGNAVGAICTTNTTCFLTNCTIANNLGSSGTNAAYLAYGTAGAFGFGKGNAVNCIFAFNTPSNFCGSLTDFGYNFSSDASIAFIGAGSRTNTDPMLGPLANNGGPTLTMALLPGSPAIDAGSATGAPTTDQRGTARPQGPGVDIGAFEFQYIPVFSGAKFQNATNFWLQLSGLLPAQAFKLQTSTNLINWIDLTNFVAGSNGICEFVDGSLEKCVTRFYRLKSSSQ
jgi:hypothetical protein